MRIIGFILIIALSSFSATDAWASQCETALEGIQDPTRNATISDKKRKFVCDCSYYTIKKMPQTTAQTQLEKFDQFLGGNSDDLSIVDITAFSGTIDHCGLVYEMCLMAGGAGAIGNIPCQYDGNVDINLPNGARYVGEWRDGTANGEGHLHIRRRQDVCW